MKIKGKTIFDFTSDESVLSKIIGHHSKNEYLKLIAKNNVQNAFDLIDLAELINDDNLRNLVEVEYKRELEEFFNE